MSIVGRIVLTIVAVVMVVVAGAATRRSLLRPRHVALWAVVGLLLLALALVPLPLEFIGTGTVAAILVGLAALSGLAAVTAAAERHAELRDEVAALREEVEKLRDEVRSSPKPGSEPKPKPPSLRT